MLRSSWSIIIHPLDEHLPCCSKLLLLISTCLPVPVRCYSSPRSSCLQMGRKSLASFSRAAVPLSASGCDSQGRPASEGRDLDHTGGNNWKLDLRTEYFWSSTFITLSRNFSEALLCYPSLHPHCLRLIHSLRHSSFSSFFESQAFFLPHHPSQASRGKWKIPITLLCKANRPFSVSTSVSLAKP